MKLIARHIFSGYSNDEKLRALDGIRFFEADVKSPEELIELFEKANPEFVKYEYKAEIIYCDLEKDYEK